MTAPPPKPVIDPRYELVEALGRGSQAETWLAKDTHREDAEVAIKVFRLSDHTDWKAFELFERECAVLRSLSHPGIPRYLDHGGRDDDGTWWLVMQYVAGQSLAQAIADRKRHTDAELRELLDRLLDVLGYLHGLNPPVYHRDIKPANVIVDATGKPVLVDFGGVRALLQSDGATVVGTFGYMAPEQLRGQTSPAADLYGLAATFAAVASGVDASDLPTQGLEIDLAACMRPGPLARTLAAMLPADPRARIQDAEQARRHLARAFEGGAPRSSPSLPAPGPTNLVPVEPASSGRALRRFSSLPRPLRKRILLVAAIGGGAALAVGAPIMIAAATFVALLVGGIPFIQGLLRGLEDR